MAVPSIVAVTGTSCADTCTMREAQENTPGEHSQAKKGFPEAHLSGRRSV